VEGYDPHHAPERPEGPFDTILCHYVLNVLLHCEQTEVLMDASELLQPSGSAFYTVRHDLQRTGYRQHYKYDVPMHQTNVRLLFETVVRTEFCEIYRYRPYPQSTSGNVECSFCSPPPETTFVSESAQSAALVDENSAAEGHTLVIPKRHVADYFSLAEREQQACWLLVNRVQSRIDEMLAPDGFNVGVDVGPAAGQTAGHAHLHVIPRYEDEDPKLVHLQGVRLVP